MPDQRPDRPFLSIQQVAEILDLDYKTIYRMVLSGHLPAARIGGVYRIRRGDLDGFFEKQKVSARAGRGSSASPLPSICGRCGQAFRVPSMVAGRCQAEGCDLALCITCWTSKDSRLCQQHATTA